MAQPNHPFYGVAATAPGKVLICGGYLVVERPNPGIALGLSARFHCVARWNGAPTPPPASAAPGAPPAAHVSVHSHQFGRTWELRLPLTPGPDGRHSVGLPSCDNPFVATAVAFALGHVAAHHSSTPPSAPPPPALQQLTEANPLLLGLYADNAFYSQAAYLRGKGAEPTLEALRDVPPFNPIVGTLAKTGLGSSACLVSSVVSAVLGFFGVTCRDAAHATAQLAHCHAQGKIGSGFDVASAIYGSSRYVRFTPGPINDIIQAVPAGGAVSPALFDALRLDHDATPCSLPAGMVLALGDISKGSSTPGMVASVFKWKKEDPGAPAVWSSLAAANCEVASAVHALQALQRSTPEGYASARAAFESTPSASWGCGGSGFPEVVAAFLRLRDAFAASRALLRKVGESAGVEIEPTQQTVLLDFTLSVEGVLAAGCPGAGGYDAVFAICVSEAARDRLTARWREFSHPEAGLAPGSVCRLDVQQDEQSGMCLKRYSSLGEMSSDYPALC